MTDGVVVVVGGGVVEVVGWLDFGSILFHTLQQGIGVARRVIFDNFLGVAIVDGVDVLCEGGARICLDLLNLLEAAAGDEESASLGVVGQDLAELADNVLEDVGRGVM